MKQLLTCLPSSSNVYANNIDKQIDLLLHHLSILNALDQELKCTSIKQPASSLNRLFQSSKVSHPLLSLQVFADRLLQPPKLGQQYQAADSYLLILGLTYQQSSAMQKLFLQHIQGLNTALCHYNYALASLILSNKQCAHDDDFIALASTFLYQNTAKYNRALQTLTTNSENAILQLHMRPQILQPNRTTSL